MNGSLNSLINAGKPGTAGSSATDLAAKLSSSNQVGKSDAATMQSDFSRWMASAAASNSQNAAHELPRSANTVAPAKTSTGQGTLSGSVEARNALARAQANAAQAKRQAPVTKAETPQAPKAEKPKAASSEATKSAKSDATKANRAKDVADKADRRTDAAQQADVGADAAKVGATPAEAVAKDVPQTDAAAATDPSSMLAWLASLTQAGAAAKAVPTGDAAHPGGADADAPLHGKDGAGQAGGTTGRDALAAIVSAADKGAIDVSALQAAEGRLAVVDNGADSGAKGADFVSSLSTEMMRGLAGKTAEAGAAAQTGATLAPSVHSPEFRQALADRVGMWVRATGEDGTMSAELHLNPAEMGPISVKISLDGHSAHVDFAAASLETRRAIEASLPMLSASLDDAGFSLSGSGVSDQSPQQQFNQASGQPAGASAWGSGSAGLASGGGDTLMDGRAVAAAQAGQRGGLDLYA